MLTLYTPHSPLTIARTHTSHYHTWTTLHSPRSRPQSALAAHGHVHA